MESDGEDKTPATRIRLSWLVEDRLFRVATRSPVFHHRPPQATREKLLQVINPDVWDMQLQHFSTQEDHASNESQHAIGSS